MDKTGLAKFVATQERPPHVEWEETNCLLCGSDDWKPLIEAPDRTPGLGGVIFCVVQCQKCDLCFTNPRPNDRTLGQFYPPSYSPHKPFRQAQSKRQSRRYSSLLKWLKEDDSKDEESAYRGKLLDFGCGSGLFLERMRGLGWDVMGVDISQDTVFRLRYDLDIPAVVGTLPHPELKPGTFDVITMWQALEHVPWPRQILEAAKDLLVPGGKLIIAVPNIASLPFKWFRKAWFALELPRHLTHFTPETLRRMIESCGLQNGPLKMIRHSNWLRLSAGLANKHIRSSMKYRFLQTKIPSSIVSWYSYLTSQTDCMMALAIKPE